MRNSKILVSVIHFISFLTFGFLENGNSQDLTDIEKKIKLEIEYKSDTSTDTILFYLTNEDSSSFHCTPICTNYNRVVVVDRNGEETELYFFIDPVGDKKAGGIKPGETYMWKLSSAVIFGNISNLYKKLDPGKYQIYWKVYNTRSKSILYILKE